MPAINRKESDQLWGNPPLGFDLPDSEIHLWRIFLDKPELDSGEYQVILAEDELARAARFHFNRDKRRFVIARATLRMILARYVGLAAEKIVFDYNKFGKPSLVDYDGEGSLEFNLSHSQELAVCAVVRNHHIGVDIEKLKELPDADQIARRFFSKGEYARFVDVSEDQKMEAFFNCWTRKEAYIKAVSEGLSFPLDQFDVTLRPEEPPKILAIDGDPQKAAHWYLGSFVPMPGYRGAFAMQGLELDICYFEHP